MPNMSVRNVSAENHEWLHSTRPPGSTLSEYIDVLLSGLRESADFVQPIAPVIQLHPDTFTFIDLFAGIGGFHIGMKANGGLCVLANEWDRFARETYRSWTSHEVDGRDIRTIPVASIPDHDVLCGGFPCQPFSLAGVSKKNSLGRAHGFDDEQQGNLFFAIRDIVQEKRPKVLLLENVKNLKSHDKGNTFRVISQVIYDLGYEMREQIIDAQGWVPQHRERIFMVCFLRDAFAPEEIASFTFPKATKRATKLRSILEKKPVDDKYTLSEGLWRYLQEYAAKHRAKGNGFGYGLVEPGDVSRTMSARYYKDGSEILISQGDGHTPRRLTPAEAARLMGYQLRFAVLMGKPKGFPQVVSDTQAYKQFGNSVCPLIVEAIGAEIVRVLQARQARLQTSRAV